MVDSNYNKIIERISNSSGVEKEEIERRVEAKRAKLSGLISKEGAAQVIAAELGVNFDDEKFKIDELLPGMKKANFTGKVIRIFPIRNFTKKSGEEGKVANLIVADDTSNIRVVLWDVNHIELIEKEKIKEDSIVEIDNARIREGEVHLGSFSEIKLSEEKLDEDNIKREKPTKEKPISEFSIGDSVKTRAFIVQAFPPKFFYVCPECKKKANPAPEEEGKYKCQQHGQVTPEKRALLNFVLDDGVGSIRCVAFHETLDKMGFDTSKQEQAQLQEEVDKLLGKEMFFSGMIRNNRYFNRPEFTVNDTEEIDVDKLISEFDGSSNASDSGKSEENTEEKGNYLQPSSGSSNSSDSSKTSNALDSGNSDDNKENNSSENVSNNMESLNSSGSENTEANNESTSQEESSEESDGEVEVQKF